MLLWRICRQPHASTGLDGRGGLFASARWHSRGHTIVYTASSRALAALEMLVHVTHRTAPADLRLLTIDLPDALAVESLEPAALPAGWNANPAPMALQAIGDQWLESLRGVALAVPSAVIPAERNVLLNPLHPDIRRVSVIEDEPFAFDARLL